ncbi:hypothetical protein [Psychroserpens luteolus]|uniref:hypothetical protein n=1 Tax=Psychroserpens luteolus TaxID=2855840 RepID=UPI001E56FD92|nr:hypothetical protein [Psychroserpens luteolus]MCD2260839.1 hypothetical protein [Psychroserpens luteolus]
MLKRITVSFLLIAVLSCQKNRVLTFRDFVAVDKIESVQMINNSGTFSLTEEQLIRFKKEVSSMTYEPNITAKVGAINMSLIIEGKSYDMTTATHGDFIEIDAALVVKNKSKFKNPFFKTNNINFDNYKEDK